MWWYLQHSLPFLFLCPRYSISLERNLCTNTSLRMFFLSNTETIWNRLFMKTAPLANCHCYSSFQLQKQVVLPTVSEAVSVVIKQLPGLFSILLTSSEVSRSTFQKKRTIRKYRINVVTILFIFLFNLLLLIFCSSYTDSNCQKFLYSIL